MKPMKRNQKHKYISFIILVCAALATIAQGLFERLTYNLSDVQYKIPTFAQLYELQIGILALGIAPFILGKRKAGLISLLAALLLVAYLWN